MRRSERFQTQIDYGSEKLIGLWVCALVTTRSAVSGAGEGEGDCGSPFRHCLSPQGPTSFAPGGVAGP